MERGLGLMGGPRAQEDHGDQLALVLEQLKHACRQPCDSPAAMRAVELWRRYLDACCFACDREVLGQVAKLYALGLGGEQLEQGCPGLAGFMASAIEVYLARGQEGCRGGGDGGEKPGERPGQENAAGRKGGRAFPH